MKLHDLKNHFPPALVLTAFVAEVLLHTVFRGRAGFLWSPVTLMILGLILSVTPLLAPAHWHRPEKKHITLPRLRVWLIWGLGVCVTGAMLAWLIPQYPINPAVSDIIPTLDSIYLKRFREASPVYAEGMCGDIPCTPNYLPCNGCRF